jgi:solute carrier family 35 (UDP-sugar transporter), member A1/2/3
MQGQSAGGFSSQFLRQFCLALIVVQNSSLILVTTYSRTLTPAYLPSVAVFLAEVVKLAAAFGLLAWELRSVRAALQQSLALGREYGRETLQFAVPAICYTLQNNLWYYALTHLDPVTAAVTSQMKVITTAIASVLMLGRRLARIQWVAIVALTAGMVVIQLKVSTVSIVSTVSTASTVSTRSAAVAGWS